MNGTAFGGQVTCAPKAIIKLEEEFGVDIFTHHDLHVRGLTESGWVLLNHESCSRRNVSSLCHEPTSYGPISLHGESTTVLSATG